MRITTLILRGAEAVEELATKLDQFVRETTAILNNGVRLGDQLAAEIKEVRYVGGETLSVRTKYTKQPLTVAVLSAKPTQTSGIIMSGNLVVWTYSDGFVTIGSIDGLNTSTDYLVTLAIVEA